MKNNSQPSEEFMALMQTNRSAITDEYFNARPHLDSENNRKLFEAGFERCHRVYVLPVFSEAESSPKGDF